MAKEIQDMENAEVVEYMRTMMLEGIIENLLVVRRTFVLNYPGVETRPIDRQLKQLDAQLKELKGE